jgi:hypothetical protein
MPARGCFGATVSNLHWYLGWGVLYVIKIYGHYYFIAIYSTFAIPIIRRVDFSCDVECVVPHIPLIAVSEDCRGP